MKLKKFLSYEWDAIAGIATAVIASVLHLLHALSEEAMLSVVLALIALLFINFMRHSRNNEISAEQISRTEATIHRIHAGLALPEVVLVGPRHLRTCHDQFTRHMKGDSVWFNVCLAMYTPQTLFDALLRPAIENPTISSVQFVLDSRQQGVWRDQILPKILECSGHEKVREPRWCHLEKNISFILADSHASDGTEALLSFWGEPFMAEARSHQAPRFIFHVHKHSELLPHLSELARSRGHAQLTAG